MNTSCLNIGFESGFELQKFGLNYCISSTESEKSLHKLNSYRYVGKERDEETGLYYYGARYYAAWLCRFVSVDPLQHKYPSISAYTFCNNNPIYYVDMNGCSFSPYFDKYGRFLGVDENGYSGQIYITTNATFKRYSKNGIGDSSLLKPDSNKMDSKNGIGDSGLFKTDSKTKKMQDVKDLSLEAQSNIYTHVLKQMTEINFSLLSGGKVAIADETVSKWNYDKDIWEKITYGYNNPVETGRYSQYKEEDGTIKVTSASGQYLVEAYTVEFIQNYLGIHEYQSHGLKNYSGEKSPVKGGTHYKAYLAQFNHKTFSKLDDSAKWEVLDRAFSLMAIENPQQYKNSYNSSAYQYYLNLKNKLNK